MRRIPVWLVAWVIPTIAFEVQFNISHNWWLSTGVYLANYISGWFMFYRGLEDK